MRLVKNHCMEERLSQCLSEKKSHMIQCVLNSSSTLNMACSESNKKLINREYRWNSAHQINMKCFLGYFRDNT